MWGKKGKSLAGSASSQHLKRFYAAGHGLFTNPIAGDGASDGLPKYYGHRFCRARSSLCQKDSN
jgi:hypothetical protein